LHVSKGASPAPGTLLGAQRVDRVAVFWEIRLTTFVGHRLLIGVAPPSCLRHGHVEMASAYLFDCAGRRLGGGAPARVYGRKMGSGDRVGVLYDPGSRTLTFFDGGVSMGVAFRGVTPPRGAAGLYPVVQLPGLPGEAVAVVPAADLRVGGGDGRGGGGSRLVDVPRGVAALASTASRWAAPPHPRDGQLLVATSAEAVAYWVAVGEPRACTVGALKARLAPLCGYTPSQMELIAGGVPLDRDDATLAAVGVRFVRGQCATQVMLYCPHLVS